MRFGVLIANGLVLGGVAWMAAFGGVGVHASQLLPQSALDGAPRSNLPTLEAQAAGAHSPRAVAALAGAYLDRDQPGLATAVVESAPREVQEQPEVAQQHARALFSRGRAREALAIARKANDACSDEAACAPWIQAKTARQAAFFEQVVAAGIDDPAANPDGVRAAYERSTHALHIVAMR